MGFLSNRIRNETALTLESPELASLFRSWGLDVNNIESSSQLSETIYFICLKHLTETQSKMPWELRKITEKKGKEKVQDNALDILLNIRPNPYYSAATFWGCIELNRLHYGNSYVYIETYKGKPTSLWILPSNEVEIWMDNAGVFGKSNGVFYVWNDSKTGKRYSFSMDEILHFKNSVTFDGLSGIAVKDILKTQIQSNMYAEGFLQKLYKSNMFGSKILVHYTGQLNRSAEENLTSTLESYSSKVGSGKFIPLPLGMQATLLDMKLSDAQFFENSKLSALQIAAAFGIKPNIINDYSKSSYSNSESQQLDFYVNTLQPNFNSYEQEGSYKLLPKGKISSGFRLAINEKILFKMDSKTQAEVYHKYSQGFIMRPNEIREELNLPYDKDGDVLIGNGNAIRIDQIGKQYEKGGKKN